MKKIKAFFRMLFHSFTNFTAGVAWRIAWWKMQSLVRNEALPEARSALIKSSKKPY